MESLWDYNNARIRELAVPIAYLVLVFLVGFPGNFSVIFIYWKQVNRCVYRTIIWNLAIADICFIAVAVPFNISRVVAYYTFDSLWACKIFCFFMCLGILYSSYLLVLLSLHRFWQVCMSRKAQISVKTVRFFIAGCFFLAFVCSIPQIVFYQLEIRTLGDNLTGSSCPVSHPKTSRGWMSYNLFLLSSFFLCLLILIFVYVLIGTKIYRQNKRMSHHSTSSSMSLQRFSAKITRIAFTVSIVFAISYLPLFILKLTKKKINMQNITDAGFLFLNIAERFYLVNHVANPFIYLIFDKRFAKKIRELATLNYKSVDSNSDSKFTSSYRSRSQSSSQRDRLLKPSTSIHSSVAVNENKSLNEKKWKPEITDKGSTKITEASTDEVTEIDDLNKIAVDKNSVIGLKGQDIDNEKLIHGKQDESQDIAREAESVEVGTEAVTNEHEEMSVATDTSSNQLNIETDTYSRDSKCDLNENDTSAIDTSSGKLNIENDTHSRETKCDLNENDTSATDTSSEQFNIENDTYSRDAKSDLNENDTSTTGTSSDQFNIEIDTHSRDVKSDLNENDINFPQETQTCSDENKCDTVAPNE